MGNVGKAVVEVYRHDVKVRMPTGKQSGGGKRKAVREFSRASRTNLLFTTFNAHADWKAFLTLTYPSDFPSNGREVKAHLNTFLAAMRFKVEKETGKEFKYMWALEWQERGAPHYHLLVESFVPHQWLAREWFNVVQSGDAKHFKAGTSVEACDDEKTGAYYMVKHYGAKSKQKKVPTEYLNVGRMWAASRKLARPVKIGEVDIRTPGGKFVVRTLRRYTESKAKPKRVRPIYGKRLNQETGEIENVQRKRAVNRPVRLPNLRGQAGRHHDFAGFKSFNGAAIASRLLESA